MADEYSTKRIINLPAESEPAEGDVFVVDNESTGTKKLPITGLIDPTLTKSGQAADAKAVGDALACKVDVDGEHQVTPQNISGMQFTKTTVDVAGENIFDSSMLFEEGHYVSINTGVTPNVINHQVNSAYNAYVIPVEPNSKYTFTQARFACLGKGNTLASESVGSLLSYATSIETDIASYLFLSIATDVTDIQVKKVTQEVTYTDFILPSWLIPEDAPTKPKFASSIGNLSDGGYLALLGYKQNLRKGERYVFVGNISEITTLTFGFTNVNQFSTETAVIYNEFIIDSQNVTYKARSTNPTYTYQYQHGLTLTNNLAFIFEYLSEGNAKITLMSNGEMFTKTLLFQKISISQVVVFSEGSTLTDCKLTWVPVDIDKKIWMFGDSYFTYSAARWTYYLQQYGYAENTLIDGWPGEGSANARNSLITLIQFGTPQYIVWCMGMNDGSDTDANTPNSNWTVRRDEMLTICNNNGITPIFATIPNVPSILHTGKNAWIKASGYRYIDFAAAVGAESADSTWFTGMLSTDNVHPTEQGARALFARVLLDFPEIMLDGTN